MKSAWNSLKVHKEGHTHVPGTVLVKPLVYSEQELWNYKCQWMMLHASDKNGWYNEIPYFFFWCLSMLK